MKMQKGLGTVIGKFIEHKDKLIIGKFCSIACGAKFIFTSANHTLNSLPTYTVTLFYEEWDWPPPKIQQALPLIQSRDFNKLFDKENQL